MWYDLKTWQEQQIEEALEEVIEDSEFCNFEFETDTHATGPAVEIWNTKDGEREPLHRIGGKIYDSLMDIGWVVTCSHVKPEEKTVVRGKSTRLFLNDASDYFDVPGPQPPEDWEPSEKEKLVDELEERDIVDSVTEISDEIIASVSEDKTDYTYERSI